MVVIMVYLLIKFYKFGFLLDYLVYIIYISDNVNVWLDVI